MHSTLCELIAAQVLRMKIRTYSELRRYDTFVDRFNYLKLEGAVGRDTFGFDRYLNQTLYNMPRWKRSRDKVIIRDEGCDLGIADREIPDKTIIIVHHMNPITLEDVKLMRPEIFDPEFLITTVLRTHNGIHYGGIESVNTGPVERRRNDTIPWR